MDGEDPVEAVLKHEALEAVLDQRAAPYRGEA